MHAQHVSSVTPSTAQAPRSVPPHRRRRRRRTALHGCALALLLAAPAAATPAQQPAGDEHEQQIRARQRLVAQQKRVDVVASRLLGALESDRRDLVSYLGIRVADHRAEENRLMAQAVGVHRPTHAFVYSVDPSGPGGAAGVQPGDQVLALAGEVVGDARAFHRRARRVALETTVPLRVDRDGKVLELRLRPEARPRGMEVLVAGDGANVYALANRREIVVSTGMLNGLATESELAAVLGHEMGHVLEGHFSTTYLDGGGEPYFSQSLEREADRFGVQLAFRAGYDPWAAAAIWERMDAQLPRQSGVPWLLSHPPNRQRIADLRDLARELTGP